MFLLKSTSRELQNLFLTFLRVAESGARGPAIRSNQPQGRDRIDGGVQINRGLRKYFREIEQGHEIVVGMLGKVIHTGYYENRDGAQQWGQGLYHDRLDDAFVFLLLVGLRHLRFGRDLVRVRLEIIDGESRQNYRRHVAGQDEQ